MMVMRMDYYNDRAVVCQIRSRFFCCCGVVAMTSLLLRHYHTATATPLQFHICPHTSARYAACSDRVHEEDSLFGSYLSTELNNHSEVATTTNHPSVLTDIDKQHQSYCSI